MKWTEVTFFEMITFATGKAITAQDSDEIIFTDGTGVKFVPHHYEDYNETFYIGVPE